MIHPKARPDNHIILLHGRVATTSMTNTGTVESASMMHRAPWLIAGITCAITFIHPIEAFHPASTSTNSPAMSLNGGGRAASRAAITLKMGTTRTRINRLSSGMAEAPSFLLGRSVRHRQRMMSAAPRHSSQACFALYSTTTQTEQQQHDKEDQPSSSQDAEEAPEKLTQEQKSILRKERKKAKAKAKRREFVGMAKAVDRGQYMTTYQPGGDDGLTFRAKSGLPTSQHSFTVLGIESSCDDTGAAIVRSDGVILGEALASQAEIHEEWGGVVPGLAKSAHEQNLDLVIEQALQDAGMASVDDVDAIAVTVGPGLEICLRVGTNRARELAATAQKPFVGIHHLEAHILMARLEQPELEFPFLALLVSGGHCQLLKCQGIGRHEIIGGTLDDSLGEAFDKTARLLGLPVGGGGGPAVEALAREGDPKSIPLTIPLQQRKDCDFSYAGLKTNVRRAAEKLADERALESVGDIEREDKANIAASFQNIAIKHIEMRLSRAMDQLEDDDVTSDIKSLALVGGVAANKELRSRLEKACVDRDWKLVVPPGRLCTDQGAMAAWAGVERLKLGSSDDPTEQEVYARFPFHNYSA